MNPSSAFSAAVMGIAAVPPSAAIYAAALSAPQCASCLRSESVSASATVSGGDSTAAVDSATAASRAAGSKVQLSDEALAIVRELQARDREVRQHEQAHLAAAGGLAVSGAVYTYQRGPDGVNYAVGGEVHIDVSPGRTPEETIERAQTIQAAALAPADPSGADRAVAAQARQMEQQAQIELQRQRLEERSAEQGKATELERVYGTADRADLPGSRIDTYG